MPSKLTYEHVKSYIESYGYTLVSTEYHTSITPLEIVCGVCAKQYTQTFTRFQMGYRHPRCITRLPSTGHEKPVPMNPIVCVICKEEFQPKRIETNLCSVECSNDSSRSDECKKRAVQNTIIEEWKVVGTAMNYEISNYGQVKNKNTKRILKPTLINGYLAVGLRANNKTSMSFIHRLVATSFVLCTDKTYVVNHKDGIKTNNHVENLEWVSLSENGKHAYRLNLHKPNRIGVSQYTLSNVLIKEYDSLLDAEWETGVFNGSISKVCRGDRGKKTAGGYIWKYTNYIPTTHPVPEGKAVTGYPNYIITRDGMIYNSQRNKYLVSVKNTGGYMFVSLSGEEIRKSFSVHRLVALLFIENPNNYLEVNHIDFDKANNKVDNLEWISRSDNMKHNFNSRQVAL